MENRRKHYFPANDYTVITGLCPNGKFGAVMADGDDRRRGYGHSRLAAIADLAKRVCLEDEEELFDHEAARADHAVALQREA